MKQIPDIPERTLKLRRLHIDPVGYHILTAVADDHILALDNAARLDRSPVKAVFDTCLRPMKFNLVQPHPRIRRIQLPLRILVSGMYGKAVLNNLTWLCIEFYTLTRKFQIFRLFPVVTHCSTSLITHSIKSQYRRISRITSPYGRPFPKRSVVPSTKPSIPIGANFRILSALQAPSQYS